jgi:hypothetical protein
MDPIVQKFVRKTVQPNAKPINKPPAARANGEF